MWFFVTRDNTVLNKYAGLIKHISLAHVSTKKINEENSWVLDVAPWSLVQIQRRFRGAYCLHYQDGEYAAPRPACFCIPTQLFIALMMEAQVSFNKSARCNIQAHDSFSFSWPWKPEISPINLNIDLNDMAACQLVRIWLMEFGILLHENSQKGQHNEYWFNPLTPKLL
jgi:hypothetical protein